MVSGVIILRAFMLAAFPTGFAVMVSFAVGYWGFRKMYYMGQMLPVFMMFYLLLAWLLYLRKTSILGWGDPRLRPKEVLGHHESDLSRDLPPDKSSGKEVRYLRDEKGLIFRVPEKDNGVREDTMRDTKRNAEAVAIQTNASIILVCSAVELAVISTLLYYWFGIGAKFFLR